MAFVFVGPRRFKVRWFFGSGGFTDDPDRWETREEAMEYIARWTSKYGDVRRTQIHELEPGNNWQLVYDSADESSDV